MRVQFFSAVLVTTALFALPHQQGAQALKLNNEIIDGSKNEAQERVVSLA